MITLGYEDPVMMPSMDVYNTDLMKAYIAGVKEQYDNARKDELDFIKEYRDFISLIPGDTLRVHDETVGAANRLINLMYANGIDPFKSPEARNAISRFIATRDYTGLANAKLSAETAKEFVKNKDALIAAGKWDPEVDALLSGGKNFDNWNSFKDGAFNRTQPFANLSLSDLTSTNYDKLDKDELIGKDPNHPGYLLYGPSLKTLGIADEAALEQLKNSPYYKIYGAKAKAIADALNALHAGEKDYVPVTGDDILKAQTRLANLRYWAQPKTEIDEWAKTKYEQLQLNYRSQLSASSKSSKSTPVEYSPLKDAVVSRLLETIGKYGDKDVYKKDAKGKWVKTNQTALLRGQSKTLSKAVKNGAKTTDLLANALSGSYDASLFSSHLGRSSISGDGSVVRVESGDSERLFTSSEILANARGYKGKDNTKLGNKKRKFIALKTTTDTSTEMTHLGSIVPVLGKDGVIRTYAKVNIKGVGTMYYDMQYYYNDKLGTPKFDENKSVGAVLGDKRAGHKGLSLGEKQITETITE